MSEAYLYGETRLVADAEDIVYTLDVHGLDNKDNKQLQRMVYVLAEEVVNLKNRLDNLEQKNV